MAEEKESSSMLSKKAISEFIHSKKTNDGKAFMIASDVWNVVNDRIKEMLTNACNRANGNKRVTVMKQDL